MTGLSAATSINYDDLRDWLEATAQLGELRIVRGANQSEDIGLAAEAVLRADAGPCVLFENIVGCAPGARLVMNIFAGRRRNMTLGLPDQLTKWDLSEAYRATYLDSPRIIPHEIVDDGPVLENVLTGDAVDLAAFPAPKWHDLDGGPYLGTGTYSITRDPEESWLNAGSYRAQLHGRDRVGIVMNTGHHGAMHRDKYFARGEACPVVMVLGGDPLSFFAGGTEAPYGVFELDMVGGLRGRPMKLVRGRLTGLPFPANAEVVLEGFIHPDEREMEGPFGEWTGYYAGGKSLQPVLKVEAIYHRNNPIILGVPPMGAGPDEMARYRAVLRSAMVKQQLVQAGVSGVEQVWCHEVGGSRLLHGISIRQRFPGHSVQAGHIASQCGAAVYASKYVIVVDEDVDVTNLDHLIWAMLTRTEPKDSIQFIEGSWDSPADPRLDPTRRAAKMMTHSVAIIDACRPYHWRNEFAPANTPKPETLRKARERFDWLMQGAEMERTLG